jgi:hypothetical protein
MASMLHESRGGHFMNQKRVFVMFIGCILFCSLVLSGCAGNASLVSNHVPTSSLTLSPTTVNIASATAVVTTTSTMDNKSIILTPDDLFALPRLQAFNTPDKEAFCEHLPSPQIATYPDKLSILSGRFVLCPWESWPWVTNTAIDLDTGSLVSKDDSKADIVMQNGHITADGSPPPFSVHSLNAAQIDGVTTDALNHEYCKQDLQSLSNNKIQGVLIVRDKGIACVKTTDGKIALIRVEEIYPPKTSSVEFSFVILKDQ